MISTVRLVSLYIGSYAFCPLMKDSLSIVRFLEIRMEYVLMYIFITTKSRIGADSSEDSLLSSSLSIVLIIDAYKPDCSGNRPSCRMARPSFQIILCLITLMNLLGTSRDFSIR